MGYAAAGVEEAHRHGVNIVGLKIFIMVKLIRKLIKRYVSR